MQDEILKQIQDIWSDFTWNVPLSNVIRHIGEMTNGHVELLISKQPKDGELYPNTVPDILYTSNEISVLFTKLSEIMTKLKGPGS